MGDPQTRPHELCTRIHYVVDIDFVYTYEIAIQNHDILMNFEYNYNRFVIIVVLGIVNDDLMIFALY